jgi:hypothetical protein
MNPQRQNELHLHGGTTMGGILKKDELGITDISA